MTYTLYIGRDGEDVYEDEITADLALRLVASIAKNRAALVEEDEEEETPAPVRTAAKKARRPRHCSFCGKTGHTTRTCPEASGGSANTSSIPTQREPLSYDEYEAVKECKVDGLSAPKAATDLGLNEKEVNVAWGAAGYTEYLEARKTLNRV